MDRAEFYRGHVNDAIKKIETYVRGLSFIMTFEKNLLVQDGVIRAVEN